MTWRITIELSLHDKTDPPIADVTDRLTELLMNDAVDLFPEIDVIYGIDYTLDTRYRG